MAPGEHTEDDQEEHQEGFQEGYQEGSCRQESCRHQEEVDLIKLELVVRCFYFYFPTRPNSPHFENFPWFRITHKLLVTEIHIPSLLCKSRPRVLRGSVFEAKLSMHFDRGFVGAVDEDVSRVVVFASQATSEQRHETTTEPLSPM